LQKASYGESDPGDDRFSVTFEMPYPAVAKQILIGRYQIDVGRSELVDTQAAP
jgi:hypothetical protein